MQLPAWRCLVGETGEAAPWVASALIRGRPAQPLATSTGSGQRAIPASLPRRLRIRMRTARQRGEMLETRRALLLQSTLDLASATDDSTTTMSEFIA